MFLAAENTADIVQVGAVITTCLILSGAAVRVGRLARRADRELSLLTVFDTHLQEREVYPRVWLAEVEKTGERTMANTAAIAGHEERLAKLEELHVQQAEILAHHDTQIVRANERLDDHDTAFKHVENWVEEHEEDRKLGRP